MRAREKSFPALSAWSALSPALSRGGRSRTVFRRPDALEVQEKAIHGEGWNRILQELRGALQLRAVMVGLGYGVALKAGQASISPAIGVQHQDDAVGSVQPDRFLDLIEDKLAVKLFVGRSQRLGAAGDLDRVRLHDTDPLEQLAAGGLEAVIEATHDRRVAVVFLPRRIQAKYFAHYFDFISSLVDVCVVSTLAARTFSSDRERTLLTASAPSALMTPSGENMGIEFRSAST